MSEQPFIQVEAASTFNRNLRTLAKKYRSIRCVQIPDFSKKSGI